jgi:SAM-dependent methyltransferase
MAAVSEADRYFATRLPADPRRTVLWQTLYNAYFKQFIAPSATVVDLGCGYGDFINAVVASRRFAVDVWPESKRYLDPAVVHHVGPVTDLSFLSDRSVDVAFASNLFEHLSRAELTQALAQLAAKLTPEGVLLIVQPNYRYAYREYFDDYTHVAVYSHVSLCDFLEANGYEVLECIPRFLPLTLKSRVRVRPWLIKLYLRSPIKLFGKQMLIRARIRN